MTRSTAISIAVMSLLALAPPAAPATITVDAGGGGDFTAIQPALDAAADGDLVLVRQGTYLITEPLDFNRLQGPSPEESKDVVLQSEAGPAATVIRMTRTEGTSRERAVIRFQHAESEASAVIGFTLTGGGHAVFYSGESSFAVLRDCIIEGNSPDRPEREAAVQWDINGYSHPRSIEDCVIVDNHAVGVQGERAGVGGSSHLYRCLVARNASSGVIASSATDCEIADNGGVGIGGSAVGCRITGNAVGVGFPYEGRGSVTDCFIAWNDGDGVAGSNTTGRVTNSVILENGGVGVSVTQGGSLNVTGSTIVRNGGHGVEVYVYQSQWAVVESCIIRGNAGLSVTVLGADQGDPLGPPPIVRYCDTAEPVAGEGNIVADPRFCQSPGGASLALSPGSPCIGTGLGGANMGASTGTCDALIVDDGAPGTEAQGNWYVSGATSPYGTRSVYSRDAGAIYNYRLLVPAAGEYDVFLWWTEWSSRVARVPVEIGHAAGTATVYVDQTANGGRWNAIGRWRLDGIARVRILSLGPGSTSADAVRIVPAGITAATVILDNGEPGTAATGSWTLSGGPMPYGVSSLYSKQTGATYSFAPSLPSPGTYRVALWWTAYSSRPDRVRVDIRHGGGTSSVFVDQRLGGGQWNDMGVYAFADSARITIVSGGNGSTCADAVKLEPAVPPAFEKVIDNGQAGSGSSGSWTISGGAQPYAESSLYSKQVGATYSYLFGVAGPGSYEVFLWWTEYPSRNAAVPVEVVTDGATTTRFVDQTRNGGQWMSLGRFAATANVLVRIRSPGGGSTCADAARVVRAP